MKSPAAKVVTTLEAAESPLPPKVQEALGELVGAAREGPALDRHHRPANSVAADPRTGRVFVASASSAR